jgi:hypothetical protein
VKRFRRRHAVTGVLGVIVVAALMLTACDVEPPDRHRQIEQITEEVRGMAGVIGASSDLANSIAQGNVHFWLSVDVADDISADQLAAVTSRYLRELETVDYTAYQTELDVHTGPNLFAVDSGTRPVTNPEQITDQAKGWVALRREFPSATITFNASVAHPPEQRHANTGSAGRTTVLDPGHPNSGAINLTDSADYTAVAAAVTTLTIRFPSLSAGTWTISAGKTHPAEIITTRRLPTPDELTLWTQLNADQSIAHVDAMHINDALSPPVWIAEKTSARDPSVAAQLARQHLPMAAQLAATVLYTASDKIQGHRNYYGQATGPIAITLGGCTVRTYRPDPAEQTLINTYEKCRH